MNCILRLTICVFQVIYKKTIYSRFHFRSKNTYVTIFFWEFINFLRLFFTFQILRLFYVHDFLRFFKFLTFFINVNIKFIIFTTFLFYESWCTISLVWHYITDFKANFTLFSYKIVGFLTLTFLRFMRNFTFCFYGKVFYVFVYVCVINFFLRSCERKTILRFLSLHLRSRFSDYFKFFTFPILIFILGQRSVKCSPWQN